MENLEIRPCPFCGFEKPKVTTKRKRIGHYEYGAPWYSATTSVRCGRCHARGPTITNGQLPSIETMKLTIADMKRRNAIEAEYKANEQKAIDEWNRRTIMVPGI